MIGAHGRITFDGRQIVGRRPEQIAAAGIAHVPQGRGTITDLTVDENLRLGAYIAPRPRGRRRHRALVRGVPAARGAPRSAGGEHERRRAADAGDRPRAHGASEARAARRAVARPRADHHAGAVPHAGRPEPRAGHLDAGGRAEREPRARDRAARLRARDGFDRGVGIRFRRSPATTTSAARTWGSDAPCRSSSPNS